MEPDVGGVWAAARPAQRSASARVRAPKDGGKSSRVSVWHDSVVSVYLFGGLGDGRFLALKGQLQAHQLPTELDRTYGEAGVPDVVPAECHLRRLHERGHLRPGVANALKSIDE